MDSEAVPPPRVVSETCLLPLAYGVLLGWPPLYLVWKRRRMAQVRLLGPLPLTTLLVMKIIWLKKYTNVLVGAKLRDLASGHSYLVSYSFFLADTGYGPLSRHCQEQSIFSAPETTDLGHVIQRISPLWREG